MNILMVAPELYSVPSPKGTSVETCMAYIATKLAKRHKVTLLCKKSENLPPKTVRGKLCIIRLPGDKKEKYINSIIHYVRGNKYDVVQIDNRPEFLSQIKKHLPGTPVSLFLHSLTYVTPPKTSIHIARKQLVDADLIIANSDSLQRELVRLYPQQKQKIYVVRLGVDTKMFRPPSGAERHAVRKKYKVKGTFTIVYAGRLIPLKGLPVLIQAGALVRKSIPKTKLVIVGSGPKRYVATIKKIAKRANIPVHFVGAIRRKSMHRMYWLGDCFVCSSQGHESFGLVIVEAMASGVPVVASQNGGIKEIVKHGASGFLVKAYHNPHAFAKAIIRIGKDMGLAKRLAVSGRKAVVAQFRWEQTADRLARIYKQFH